jgi:hypothetical protein
MKQPNPRSDVTGSKECSASRQQGSNAYACSLPLTRAQRETTAQRGLVRRRDAAVTLRQIPYARSLCCKTETQSTRGLSEDPPVLARACRGHCGGGPLCTPQLPLGDSGMDLAARNLGVPCAMGLAKYRSLLPRQGGFGSLYTVCIPLPPRARAARA